MPNWTDRPPEDDRSFSLPLIRCPASGSIWGLVTSETMIGTQTHYWHGRTIPCSEQNCPACVDGFPWRWHGYVGLLLLPKHQHVILEMTAQAVEPIVKWADGRESIRGTALQAKRIGNRKNGRVLISVKAGDPERIQMPDVPNLVAALGLIWSLPTEDLQPGRAIKKVPSIAVERNEIPPSMRKPKSNGRSKIET